VKQRQQVMPRRRQQIPTVFPYEVTDIIKMDDIYTVINYVQLSRETCKFVADKTDALTMQTLLKDVEMSFDTKSHENGVQFTVFPPPEREVPEEQIIFADEDFPDEKIEPGQCF